MLPLSKQISSSVFNFKIVNAISLANINHNSHVFTRFSLDKLDIVPLTLLSLYFPSTFFVLSSRCQVKNASETAEIK